MLFRPNANPVIKGFFEGIYIIPVESEIRVPRWNSGPVPIYPIHGTIYDLPLDFVQALLPNANEWNLRVLDVSITPDNWNDFDGWTNRGPTGIFVNIDIETNLDPNHLLKNYEAALLQIAPAINMNTFYIEIIPTYGAEPTRYLTTLYFFKEFPNANLLL